MSESAHPNAFVRSVLVHGIISIPSANNNSAETHETKASEAEIEIETQFILCLIKPSDYLCLYLLHLLIPNHYNTNKLQQSRPASPPSPMPSTFVKRNPFAPCLPTPLHLPFSGPLSVPPASQQLPPSVSRSPFVSHLSICDYPVLTLHSGTYQPTTAPRYLTSPPLVSFCFLLHWTCIDR